MSAYSLSEQVEGCCDGETSGSAPTAQTLKILMSYLGDRSCYHCAQPLSQANVISGIPMSNKNEK